MSSRAEYHRKWREENPEKKSLANRKWRENNSDKKHEYDKLYSETHKSQDRERAKKYYQEHKEAISERRKLHKQVHPEKKEKEKNYTYNYRTDKRKRLIEIMGGKCVICGFNDWRALQIDHINSGGAKERNEVRSVTRRYKIIENSINKNENKYQLLCANCNQIKTYINNEHT